MRNWNLDPTRDRIAGCLVGQAVGDALGAGYEYGRRVRPQDADLVGGGFGFAPGEWTDDTQQAVAVARALAAGDKFPWHLAGKGLLAWYAGSPKDVGSTTSAALGGAKGDPRALKLSARRAAQSTSPSAISNGSIMRTSPVALAFREDPIALRNAARGISDLTHGSPYAGDACVLWSCALAHALSRGITGSLRHTMWAAMAHIPESRMDFWSTAMGSAFTHPPAYFQPNGRAVLAFQSALSAAAHADSFEQGVRMAVGAGGDTDTVAAIAGALLGARFGLGSIPARWVEKIHGWPGLTADGLVELALETAGSPAPVPDTTQAPQNGVVRAGQLWKDNDPRRAGRTLRVSRVDDTHAVCLIETDTEHKTSATVVDRRGVETRVALDRFRPIQRGYSLIPEG